MIKEQNNYMITDEETHKILDNVSDSIILFNPKDYQIVYFNKAVYESLGYTKDEFQASGNHFFTQYNSESFIEEAFQQVLAGQRLSFITKHVTKTGSIQYADINLSLIEINNTPHICGIWKDITTDVANAKQASIKNKRLKKFLEVLTLLNNSNEFLSIDIKKYAQLATRLMSNAIDIDRVSIRLYSQEKNVLDSISLFDRNQKDRLVGKTLTRAEYPVFFDYIESNNVILIHDIKKSKTLKNMIKVFFSEDGMINSLLATRIVVDNEVVGYIFLQSKTSTHWDREYVLFASQISDQIGIMLINKELKKQQHLLERLVEKRTKALEIAKNTAELATISKTRFLSNISHEIRTPLNAVIGFLSLIDSTQLDPKTIMYIDHIKEGSNNLLDIINDVLDIAKMEAGKMEAHIELVDLKKFFDKKVNFYAELFKNNHLLFEFNYQCNNNYFHTDLNLLNMIINNLLSNALKYTKEGKVKLQFLETEVNDHESKISIIVEDTGIGIKEKDFHKIFKTFEQIEQRGLKEYKGTGLGLALTKQIVELLNGTIRFNSEYSKGTTFSLELPMKSQTKHIAISVANSLEQDYDQLRFPNKRVLLVDDHEHNLAMLIAFLENTGLEVDTVSNGLLALKKLEFKTYDLIFMDLHMPVLDGLTASQLIRLHQDNSNLPIIALTANACQGDTDKIKYAIFDDYILKPVNKQTILKTCYDFLIQSKPIASRKRNSHSFLDLIKEFSEINVEDGLYYVSNNVELYQIILFEFLESHYRDFEYLLNCIEDNDMDGAYRILHTLKSLVKTIGMNDLHPKIIAIESSIINKDSINQYIDDLHATKDLFEKEMYIIKYIRHTVNGKMEVPNEI